MNGSPSINLETSILKAGIPELHFIQDAHTQTAAQKDIRNHLNGLLDTQSISLVAVEGSRGRLRPEYLESLGKNAVERKAAIEQLVNLGELSGAELFAWDLYQKNKQLPIVGVENPYLFRRNLKIYRWLLAKQDALETLLEPINLIVDKVSTQKLTAETIAFLKERKRRKEGDYNGQPNVQSAQFLAYLNFLSQQAAKRLQINLNLSIEQTRFPNLHLILKTNKNISRKISLLNFARLNYEINTLESALLLNLSPDKDSQDWLAWLDRYANLQDLLRVKLTNDEWHNIDLKILAPTKLLASYEALSIKNQSIQTLELFYQRAAIFYKLAEIRDRVLVENSYRAFIQYIGDQSLLRKNKRIALVSGGFHLVGARKRVETIGAEFTVYQPKIDQLNDESHLKSVYLKMNATFRGSAAPFTSATDSGVHSIKSHHTANTLLLTDRSIYPLLDGASMPYFPTRAESRSDATLLDEIKVGFIGARAGFEMLRRMTADRQDSVMVIDTQEEMSKIALSALPVYKDVRELPSIKLSGDSNSQSEVNKMLAEKDVVFIDSILPYDDKIENFEKYLEGLRGWARQLGDALHDVRHVKQQISHKVFVLRAPIPEDFLTEIYNIIKYHAKPKDSEKLNFDLVYSPDMGYRDDQGNYREPNIAIGFLNQADNAHGDKDSTKKIISRLFQTPNQIGVQIQFMNAESARMAKDGVMFWLASKLAHFNDMAAVTEAYGGDISAVSYGAGLDKRILASYSSPSLGFGGKLLQYLRFSKLSRLYSQALQSKKLPEGNGSGLSQVGLQMVHEEANIKMLTEAFLRSNDLHGSIGSLEDSMKMAAWIEIILKINERTQQNFLNKITSTYLGINNQQSFTGRTIAVLGVGYKRNTGDITDSPAVFLIEQLFLQHKAKNFIISDPDAEVAFKKWLDYKKKTDQRFNDLSLTFEYADLYGAVAKSDLVIIPTDSHPDIESIDLDRFKSALNGKIVFDGMNIFGLRANGQTIYPIESLHRLGINYVSVGRSIIGEKFTAPTTPQNLKPRFVLKDSEITPKGINLSGADTAFDVTIVGGGYVGLVTGAVLSNLGHNVNVVELNAERVNGLKADDIVMPIYEPGLREMILENRNAGRIHFYTEIKDAATDSSIVYVAVGTPSNPDGSINLAYIEGAARSVFDLIKSDGKKRIIVVKSTVTPRAFERIEEIAEEMKIPKKLYAVGSNPEFLKEGTALADYSSDLDRTVLGLAGDSEAEKILLDLWAPLKARHDHAIFRTDRTSAPLGKYAANALLAVNISFANLLAYEAAKVGADYRDIRALMRVDPRIGRYAFLFPGCGYGGSCFPKDVSAIDDLSEDTVGENLALTRLAHEFNNQVFKRVIVERTLASTSFGNTSRGQNAGSGKIIALWGLSFKPATDDLREASSLTIIYEYLKRGVKQIRIHDYIRDEEAISRDIITRNFLAGLYKLFKGDHLYEGSESDFSSWFKLNYFDNNRVVFFDDPVEAVLGKNGEDYASALNLVTEWPQYKTEAILRLLTALKTSPQSVAQNKHLIIGDGRNHFSSPELADLLQEAANSGLIEYFGIGIPPITGRAEVRSERVKLLVPTNELADNQGGFLSRVTSLLNDKNFPIIQSIISADLPVHPILLATSQKIPESALGVLADPKASVTIVLPGTDDLEAENIRYQFLVEHKKSLSPGASERFFVLSNTQAADSNGLFNNVLGNASSVRFGLVAKEENALESYRVSSKYARYFDKDLTDEDRLMGAYTLLKLQVPNATISQNIVKQLTKLNFEVQSLMQEWRVFVQAIRQISASA